MTGVRSLHDIITINNIDDEDFTFEYDRSRGNYPYTIKAGAVARFPRFLADHAVKHLIDKILNKKRQRTNNEAARADLASKIYIGEEVFQQKDEASEAERTRQQVEDLNKPSDLEKIIASASMGAPKGEPEKEEVVIGQTQTPSETPVNEEVTDETPKVEEVKALPTRNELFDFAEKNGLVLDEADKQGKTLRQTLSKMTIPEMMEAIQYE